MSQTLLVLSPADPEAYYKKLSSLVVRNTSSRELIVLRVSAKQCIQVPDTGEVWWVQVSLVVAVAKQCIQVPDTGEVWWVQLSLVLAVAGEEKSEQGSEVGKDQSLRGETQGSASFSPSQ